MKASALKIGRVNVSGRVIAAIAKRDVLGLRSDHMGEWPPEVAYRWLEVLAEQKERQRRANGTYWAEEMRRERLVDDMLKHYVKRQEALRAERRKLEEARNAVH